MGIARGCCVSFRSIYIYFILVVFYFILFTAERYNRFLCRMFLRMTKKRRKKFLFTGPILCVVIRDSGSARFNRIIMHIMHVMYENIRNIQIVLRISA